MATLRPPSIVEVAQRAGVSVATVSRVLNRSASVNPATADQVLRTTRELGYELPPRKPRLARPSRRAAGLRTGNIAIISLGRPRDGWLEMSVMAQSVLAVTRAAQANGLNVLLEEMPDPSQLSSAVRSGSVDGAVVWLSNSFKTSDLQALARQVPIVRAMGDQLEPLRIDHVGPNNRAVGYMAYDYLRQRGCGGDVAFLSVVPGWDLTRIRASGFFDAARQAGATSRALLVSNVPIEPNYGGSVASSYADIQSAVDAMLSLAPLPKGLFVSRDVETVRVCAALASRGVRPGEDIVIVSCDNDSSPLAKMASHPATIDLNPEEVGRRALHRLLQRIQKPDEPIVQILVMPRLITTGAALPGLGGGERDDAGRSP